MSDPHSAAQPAASVPINIPIANPQPPSIREVQFHDWEDFKSRFCAELFPPGEPFSRGKYLFRGHSNPHWTLKSAFDRMFEGQSKSRRLNIWNDMLALFRRNAQGDEFPPAVREDESQLVALGQHYGLPTRLLDWTESPYTAAFFAYNSTALWGQADQQIVIWVLDTEHPIWSSHYGVQIVDVPSVGNRRIRNQSGKFTLLQTPHLTLEEYVAATGEDGDPLLRFVLPANEYRRVLSDLDAMSIHHGTVYPEVEGAAQMALFRTVLKHNAFVQTQTPRPS